MHRKIAISMFVLIITALLVAFGAAVSFYRSVSFDPSLLPKNASTGRGTIFLDRRGRELRFLPDQMGERARWIPLQEVPEQVRNAFIAAEDERFYRHSGFDVAAILRAAWSNLIRRKIFSGASTISQQVVRMIHQKTVQSSEFRVQSEKTGKRSYYDKAIEIVRSIKLEKHFSKNEILEQYLNRAPMGNNLIGVETASRAYFGKHVKSLSISESALLASLPKAPGMLNPYGDNLERLIERRDWTLERMQRLGMIADDECLQAKEERPRLGNLAFDAVAPHLIDQLSRLGVADGRVRTTIDRDLQIKVQEILLSHRERLRYKGASQAAAIVIHNPTLEALATAGSIEYSEKDDGYNNAVLAPRSAGSTLKPFLYGLALDSGHTATTLLEDTERKYRARRGQYAPSNFDRKQYGPVTMRIALGNSLNLSAVRMLDRVGLGPFHDMLTRMDLISRPGNSAEYYGLGLAIGNVEVSPEKLAAAYAMLANGGKFGRVKYLIHEKDITNAANGTNFTNEGSILLPQSAYIITDILSDPSARMLTFNRGRGLSFPFSVAVKTGTSTFFRDLWAVGYTPDYTVCVWAGNFDGSSTNRLSGATAAAPILSDIMNHLYRAAEPPRFRRPNGIKSVRVCGYSGMVPSEHCGHASRELFISGTEPTSVCTFHAYKGTRHELAASYAGWLYDKNRTGSAGRFRLSGFDDDLSMVFDDPYYGTDIARGEPTVRMKNGLTAMPAAPQPAGSDRITEDNTIFTIGADNASIMSSRNSVKIIYPIDNDGFVKDKYRGGQAVMLQAVNEQPVPFVEWYINGSLYKRSGPPYQAYWPLEPGIYRITAVDPSQNADSVEVRVE